MSPKVRLPMVEPTDQSKTELAGILAAIRTDKELVPGMKVAVNPSPQDPRHAGPSVFCEK
jgi:hypothetical protein